MNVDYWKGFVFDRLTTAPGGGGHLDFYGDTADEHAMIFRHCSSERGVWTTTDDGGGREFEKWVKAPNTDNHLWDCLVGCSVAAAVGGLVWNPTTTGQERRVKKVPVKLSELYAAKQKARAGH